MNWNPQKASPWSLKQVHGALSEDDSFVEAAKSENLIIKNYGLLSDQNDYRGVCASKSLKSPSKEERLALENCRGGFLCILWDGQKVQSQDTTEILPNSRLQSGRRNNVSNKRQYSPCLDQQWKRVACPPGRLYTLEELLDGFDQACVWTPLGVLGAVHFVLHILKRALSYSWPWIDCITILVTTAEGFGFLSSWCAWDTLIAERIFAKGAGTLSVPA